MSERGISDTLRETLALFQGDARGNGRRLTDRSQSSWPRATCGLRVATRRVRCGGRRIAQDRCAATPPAPSEGREEGFRGVISSVTSEYNGEWSPLLPSGHVRKQRPRSSRTPFCDEYTESCRGSRRLRWDHLYQNLCPYRHQSRIRPETVELHNSTLVTQSVLITSTQ